MRYLIHYISAKFSKAMRNVYIRVTIVISIVIQVVFLEACKTTVKVAAPEEVVKVKSSYVRQLSSINIPVKIPVSELETQINKYLTGVLYEDKSFTNNDGDNLKCVVKKYANIKFDAVDNKIKLNLPLDISGTYKRLGVGVDFSGKIRAKYTTSIVLKNGWKLSTETKSNGYEWIVQPKVSLGIVDFQVGWIVDVILLSQGDKVNASIDEAIKDNVDLLGIVKPGLEALLEPFNISEEYKTWFQITPVEILATQISTRADTVLLKIGLQAYTETKIGNKPMLTNLNDTIPFKVVKELPDDFNMGIVTILPYKEITALMTKEFVTSGYEYKEGRYHLKFTKMNVYAQDENMIIQVGLLGSVNGDIYLKGKPYYDPATRMIKMKDLDFELDSKQALLKTTDWLVHGTLCKVMNRYFVFPIGEELDAAKKDAQVYFQNYEPMKGVIVNGKLNSVETSDLYLIQDGIVTVLNIDGRFDIQINGMD
jgi:hypothetical protein